MALDKKELRQSLRDPRHAGFVGQQFARYEILATLGKGGSAMVFRAKHRELGSLVALKLLLQEDSNPDAVIRFKREGQVLAQIKHPNVVGVNDLGEENGIYFLAMELVEGENLYKMVRGPGGQPFEPTEAVEIAKAIAEALAYCHERGAIHRDVKPNNILVEHGTRRAVLMDFGLVKREVAKLGGDATAATLSGMVMGTPGFMAPEQFEPNGPYGKVGQKTDVWGLGATLYFLLTGRPPFDQTNVVDLYSAVTTSEVTPPSVHRPGISRALDEVVLACLRRQVDDRIGMPELARRLEQLRGGLTREGSRRGLKHAAAVSLFFAGLVALDLAVLEKERGRDLLRSLGLAPAAAPGGDPVEGIELLEQQAAAGDVAAMTSLAVQRYKGQGVEKDAGAAADWFRQAADRGSPAAMLWLGHLYEKGEGVPGGKPDLDEALSWYEKAAAVAGDSRVAEQARAKAQGLKRKRSG